MGHWTTASPGLGTNLYSPDATEKTYRHLAELAGTLLASGLSVIVDAACLKEKERALFAEVAENQGVPFTLLHCEAPEDLRREWVRKRKGDASEATEELLDAQKNWFEPLTTEEKTHTVHLHTNEEHVAEAVADRIRQHLGITKQV